LLTSEEGDANEAAKPLSLAGEYGVATVEPEEALIG
jgi:hypothetical protein